MNNIVRFSVHLLSEIRSFNDSFHNIFINGDWSLENIKTEFGDTPSILNKVLQRRSCSVDVVQLLLENGADINCLDEHRYSPLMIAVGISNDEAVIRKLLQQGAEVNKVNVMGRTPLLMHVHRKDCSIGIVQALLDFKARINHEDVFGASPLAIALHRARDDAVIRVLVERGADVNFVDMFGQTPLMIAIECSRDEAIIRMLMEGDVDVNHLDCVGRSPLCRALACSSSNVVKLLMDSGSSLTACKSHFFPLFCAADFPNPGLKEDVLALLFERNFDVNSVNRLGQSVLCFALCNGANAYDIQLLLNAGASIHACQKHFSSLTCATDCKGTLRKDVIQLLLDNRACGDNVDWLSVRFALGYCKYETEAIQLLLNLPGMDAYVAAEKTLLHCAVSNRYCRLDALKLLVDGKDRIESVNEKGETLLHCAIKNTRRNLGIIKFLLQNGCPINTKSNVGETALTLAVGNDCDSSIIKDLLFAGAHIGKTKFVFMHPSFKCELFELLVREWENCTSENINKSYKMLLKFFLLQNPEFDIKNLQNDRAVARYCINKILTCSNECLSELRKMESLRVGHGHTLRTCVSGNCLFAEENDGLDQVMIHLMENTYPVYFDVISARISRSILEAEVKKLQVYTYNICSMKRAYLNCDVLLKISKYLSNDDLLSFILALYRPINQKRVEANKDDSVLDKRNCQPSTKLLKYSKCF